MSEAFPKDDERLIALHGIIEKITDGGATWTLEKMLRTKLHSVFFTDSKTGYAIGEEGTILKKITGGTGVSKVAGNPG